MKQQNWMHLFIIGIMYCNLGFAQQVQVKNEKMEQLRFMIGEWIGTSTIYEDEKVSKQAAAFEKISYDLDKSILVIQLNSELLQLHTIIYYDEKDKTYYYYPFSKRGVARIPATFNNGKLIVSRSADNRFIFEKMENGGFREYGEKRVNGKWVTYFEDKFINSQ